MFVGLTVELLILVNTVSLPCSLIGADSHTQIGFLRDMKTAAPEDATSFLRSQEDWGEEREHRPPVLFNLYRPQQTVSVDPGFLFTPYPSNTFPELQVVVDGRTGKPLRNISDLPIVISTKVQGWILEAWMRLDPRMNVEDIIQRMPHLTRQQLEKRGGAALKNSLSGRRKDFRHKGRCLSWEQNTPLQSTFDERIMKDIHSNPDWVRDQTTRYLLDLTKEEINQLVEENKKRLGVKRGHVDEPGSGSAHEDTGDGEEGIGRKAKEPKFSHDWPVDPSLGGPPRFFGPGEIEFAAMGGEEQARRNQGFETMQEGLNRPPVTYDPSLRRPLTLGHTRDNDPSQYPLAFPPNAMPFSGTPTSPESASSELLLTGANLVAWLAARGVRYAPSYPIGPVNPGQADARFSPATSSEERRQLFLSLHPVILEAVSSMTTQRFVVDLSLSYAYAYGSLQDQFVHASYRKDNAANLGEAEQRLFPQAAWAGDIADFDIAGLAPEEVAGEEDREAYKAATAPYTISPELQMRAVIDAMVDENGGLFWPDRVVVQAVVGESGDWLVQLVDFAE